MARRGSTSKTLVWILMALLILGLGGFGVTNLGGSVRSIGSVGDKDIDVNVYATALREEMQVFESQIGRKLTLVEAQQLGLDRSALSRVVATRAMDHEAAELGLSIGDETLRRQILEIPAFQGADGKFDRDAYKYALDNAGLKESAFESSMREDTARSILQSAVVSGIKAPAPYINVLTNYLGEQRDLSWLRLSGTDLETPLETPTEADLVAFHEENIAQYTLPETKRITYAWVTPDKIAEKIDIEDAVLREAYESRDAEFNQPERRLTERLAFAKTEDAEAAKAAIDAGETTFDKLVEDRGLTLADVDLGDITRKEAGSAADALFEAEAGDVIGPFASNVGPALFRLNAVLRETSVSFEDAKSDLRAEIAADRARRQIDASYDTVSDLLAGGATLEEIATETDLEVAAIDWTSDATDPINGYESFREAAASVREGDFPEVVALDDGGIFALRLDEVVAPRAQPLKDVRDTVVTDWETRQTTQGLRAQAETLKQQLSQPQSDAGRAPQFETVAGLTRGGFVEGMPENFIETAFALDTGEMEIIDAPASVILVRVDDITPPDPNDEEMAQGMRQLEDQAESSLAQDIYAIFSNAVRSRAGISLDQAAINAVHANFQ